MSHPFTWTMYPSGVGIMVHEVCRSVWLVCLYIVHVSRQIVRMRGLSSLPSVLLCM